MRRLRAAFARRRGVDGKGVDAGCELTGKYRVDHAVALQPALSAEGLRHDMNAKMGLPARPMPGVPRVLVGFVDHVEGLRRESLGQLLCDEIGGPHAARLGEDSPLVNGGIVPGAGSERTADVARLGWLKLSELSSCRSRMPPYLLLQCQ